MRINNVLVILFLFAFNFVKAQYGSIVTVKSSNCPSHKDASERTFSTGFYAELNGFEGIVTALHAVCGCENRYSAYTRNGKVFNYLRIIAVDVEHDVVILGQDGGGKLQMELVEHYEEPINQLSDKTVKIAGHPEGRKALIIKESKVPEVDYYVKLEDILTVPILKRLKERNSPLYSSSVLHFDGQVIPGHSGAPVLYNGKVVAVTAGYMDGEIGWGALIRDIKLKNFGSVKYTSEYISLAKKNPEDVYELTSSRFSLPIDAFPQNNDKFRILILPFNDYEKTIHKEKELFTIEDSIYQHLLQDPNVLVKRENSPEFMPTSRSEAEDLGKEFNADMVLYGDYLNNDSTDINYTVIDHGNPYFLHSVESSRNNVASSSNANDFGVIPLQISFILKWAQAIKLYRDFEFIKALELLQEIEPHTKRQLREYYFKLGTIYKELLDKENMLNYYYKVLTLDSTDSRVYYNIGHFNSVKGLEDSVVVYYKKSFELENQHRLNHQILTNSLYNLCVLTKNKEEKDYYGTLLKSVDEYLYNLLEITNKLDGYINNSEWSKAESLLYDEKIKPYKNILCDYYAFIHQFKYEMNLAKYYNKQAYKNDGFNFDALFRLTNIYIIEEKYDSANYYLNKLKIIGGKNYRNTYLGNEYDITYAKYLAATGDSVQAKTLLSNLNINTNTLSGIVEICYNYLDDYETIIELFEKNQETFNDLSISYQNHILGYYGAAMYALDYDTEEVAEVFKKIYYSSYSEYSLSWLSYLYPDETDSLEFFIREAENNNVENFEVLMLKGYVLRANVNYDSSLYYYEKARKYINGYSKEYKAVKNFQQTAYNYEMLSKYDSAIYYYNLLLRVDSSDCETYKQIANLYFKKLNLSDSAAKYLDKYYACNSTYETAIEVAEKFEDKYKNYPEAEKYYLIAIDYSLDSLNNKENPMYKLAKLYHYEMKRYADAEKYYKQFLKESGDYFWGYYNLAKLYHYELNQYNQAVKLYKKAIKLDDNSYWSKYRLGDLYLNKIVDYDKSEDYFNQAIKNEKDCDECYLKLAELYKNMGNKQKAKESYEKAIKIDPDNKQEKYDGLYN